MDCSAIPKTPAQHHLLPNNKGATTSNLQPTHTWPTSLVVGLVCSGHESFWMNFFLARLGQPSLGEHILPIRVIECVGVSDGCLPGRNQGRNCGGYMLLLLTAISSASVASYRNLSGTHVHLGALGMCVSVVLSTSLTLMTWSGLEPPVLKVH